MPYGIMFLLGPHTSSRTHVAKHAFLPVPVVFVITTCPDAQLGNLFDANVVLSVTFCFYLKFRACGYNWHFAEITNEINIEPILSRCKQWRFIWWFMYIGEFRFLVLYGSVPFIPVLNTFDEKLGDVEAWYFHFPISLVHVQWQVYGWIRIDEQVQTDRKGRAECKVVGCGNKNIEAKL